MKISLIGLLGLSLPEVDQIYTCSDDLGCQPQLGFDTHDHLKEIGSWELSNTTFIVFDIGVIDTHRYHQHCHLPDHVCSTSSCFHPPDAPSAVEVELIKFPRKYPPKDGPYKIKPVFARKHRSVGCVSEHRTTFLDIFKMILSDDGSKSYTIVATHYESFISFNYGLHTIKKVPQSTVFVAVSPPIIISAALIILYLFTIKMRKYISWMGLDWVWMIIMWVVKAFGVLISFLVLALFAVILMWFGFVSLGCTRILKNQATATIGEDLKTSFCRGFATNFLNETNEA